MNTYSVIEFEQRHNGQMMKLYAGVISADELVERYHIPEYNTNSDTGYQRPVYPSRLGQIASYILNREGVMPTSILANIRQGAHFRFTTPPVGELSVPIDQLLEMVDGQHRAKALRLAKERKQPLPYTLPIVFTLGLNEEEEMNLFYIVNSTQKSVPTDLTAEIMRKRIDTKAQDGKAQITITELRRLASVQIARIVALNPQSVWFHKIQMADEVKQFQKPIRLATFAHTLEPFLSGDWAHNLVFARDAQSLSVVVENYWLGLRLLMPAAFDEPRLYSVQSPTGAWVFGWVLRDMVRLADKANDWSPEFFADQLKSLAEWVDSQTWHREYGDDLARAKGSGVARLIFEKIYPLYRPTNLATGLA